MTIECAESMRSDGVEGLFFLLKFIKCRVPFEEKEAVELRRAADNVLYSLHKLSLEIAYYSLREEVRLNKKAEEKGRER